MAEEVFSIIKNKNVLITGGGGFIGSNLAETLCENNNDVVVFDNFDTGQRKNLEGLDVTIIEGSITDFEGIIKALVGIEYIFHLAALPSVPRSIRDPIQTNEVNISGTLNLLVASKEQNVKKLVYASSSSVYGDTPTLPKVETMIPNPQSPYAVSKLAGEYYCKVFFKVYGLPTTIVRYFNVYGPRQDPKSDYAAVIPKFISRLRRNEGPMIYGDGEQTRDFTFVKDAVRATILAGEANNVDGEVINVAGGKRIRINELAKRITKLMGMNIKPIYTELREGDIKHSLADINKAKEKINYFPAYDLDRGLFDTVDWFLNH